MANVDKIKDGAGNEYPIVDATAVHPSDLAKVATTGSYSDLMGKPAIHDLKIVDKEDGNYAGQLRSATSRIARWTGSGWTGVSVYQADIATSATKASQDINGTTITPQNETIRNNLGDPTLFEAGVIPEEFNNQLEFHPFDKVEYESSLDGETWETFPITEAQHKSLWGGTAIPGVSVNKTTRKYMRMTILCYSYVYLGMLYMYCSGNGITCDITLEKYHTGNQRWTTVYTQENVSLGWPAHHVFKHSTIPFSPTSATQYSKIRLTFVVNNPGDVTKYPSYTLYKFKYFGGYPYFVTKTHSIDGSKNWIFPAKVSVGGSSTNEVYSKGGPVVAIADGGTGASTAAAACTNLGLGSLATKSSVTDSDISGTIADSHISSASTWNGKQDALAFTTADEITEILGGLE